MKILHILNNADTGGAQTLVESLALNRSAGTEIHLAVLEGTSTLSERFERAFDCVSYLGIDRRSWNAYELGRRIRSVIKSGIFDIVHSHLFQSDMAVLLQPPGAKYRSVSTVHTTGQSETGERLRTRWLARIIAIASRRFDATVACGESANRYMDVMAYRSKKISVIANGVPIPPLTRRTFATTTPQLVCLSRWHPMKDHDTLFGGFAILLRNEPAARLICAGTGMTSDNTELAAMIGDHGLERNVTLEGAIREPSRLFANADMLVSSSSYGEALPMAGLEAIANGVPVVSTDVGDCRRLVLSSAQLAGAGDKAGLAAAMAHVLSLSPEQRKDLSTASRAIAEQGYSIESTVEKYESLYRKLLAVKHGC